MKSIFITGYMCSGKTTFGKALAEKTGMKFIDLDEYIEKEQGKAITEIFQEEGEPGFRKIERKKLSELPSADCIIACGGGTPCFFDNMDFINRTGFSVFLDTSPETLLRRLLEGREQRPIVAGKTSEEIKQIIETQLEERSRFYRMAHITGDGENLDTEAEIGENVSSFIRDYGEMLDLKPQK